MERGGPCWPHVARLPGVSGPETDDERFVPVRDARPEDVPWPAMTWPPPAGVRLAGRLVEVVPAVPERDAEGLFLALDDDQVWQHLAGRPRRPQAYVERLEQQRAAGALPWAVRLRTAYAVLPAGAVVGTSTYLDVSVRDARLEIGSTAYAFRTWGTAVNPDTKLALLNLRLRGARRRASAAEDRCTQHPLPAGHRPAWCPVRRNAAPLPAPSRRERARHRPVLHHQR